MSQISRRINDLRKSADHVDRDDGDTFSIILNEMNRGNLRTARSLYNKMDTAAREDFVENYTENYINEGKIKKLEKKLKIKFNR